MEPSVWNTTTSDVSIPLSVLTKSHNRITITQPLTNDESCFEYSFSLNLNRVEVHISRNDFLRKRRTSEGDSTNSQRWRYGVSFRQITDTSFLDANWFFPTLGRPRFFFFFPEFLGGVGLGKKIHQSFIGGNLILFPYSIRLVSSVRSFMVSKIRI